MQCACRDVGDQRPETKTSGEKAKWRGQGRPPKRPMKAAHVRVEWAGLRTAGDQEHAEGLEGIG